MDVREIGEDELPLLVEVARAVQAEDPPSVAGLIDWRRQASDMVWLLVTDDDFDMIETLYGVGYRFKEA